MEELNLEIDLGELEEIEKGFGAYGFDFPVAYFGVEVCFNKMARQLCGDAIKWFVSSEYIIGLPAGKNEKNAYRVQKNGFHKNVYTARFPTVLRTEKKVKPGYYKLYKYKDGFAFKRYEPMEM